MSDSTPSPAWESRRNNLDFLRFLLACVVIHTHSYHMTGRETPAGTSIMGRLARGDIGGAWLAVDGFFIVSGFLITQSWLRSKSPLDYFKRRTLRIYPGFIASVLLCMFVVGPLGGANLATYFTDPATYSFLRPLAFGPVGALPGVFTHQPWGGGVNDSLWTIRFELFCYILLAAMGMLGILRLRFIVLGLFIVAVASQVAQQAQWPRQWTMVLPYFGDVWEIVRFVVFFLAGATFYLFRERIPFSMALAALTAALLVIAFRFNGTTLLLPICGTYLLLFVGFHPRLPLQNFSKYGDFSYGMYLYAFPIQQLLVMYAPPARNPVVLSILAFFCTLAAAAASWYVIEKPFLRLKRASSAPAHHQTLTSPLVESAPLP